MEGARGRSLRDSRDDSAAGGEPSGRSHECNHAVRWPASRSWNSWDRNGSCCRAWDSGSSDRVATAESGRCAFAGDHLPVPLEATQNAGAVGVADSGTGVDHDVDSGQLMLVLSKRLSDEALDPVASNRVADDACCSRQPKSWPIVAVVVDEHGKHCIAKAARIAIDAIELRLVVKPLSRGEWTGRRWQFELRERCRLAT